MSTHSLRTIPATTDPRASASTATARSGFTFVELIVVLVVLAILAAIAIPKFADASGTAKVNVITDRFKLIYRTYELYHREHLAWPPDNDGVATTLHVDSHFQENPMGQPSPIGGTWAFGNDAGGEIDVRITNVGAPTAATTDVMTKVDTKLDDGNLATGYFTYTATGNHTYRYFLRKP